MSFIGRESELRQLGDFIHSDKAGLAVVCGRRRVGKSTLIEHACRQTRFFEFYGLAPRKNLDNNAQLKHFGELMGLAFHLPAFQFSHWNEAFSALAEFTATGRVVILFDEISWMAAKDKDFSAKLKGMWDTKFKKNNQLSLILCGSVTSWIEENILQDKGYVGRVSLTIRLEEMPLFDANKFWGNNQLISAFEKFKILCVTGGIPRYLEEINVRETAEKNIKRMCFSREGFLFSEFDKIFKDIFESKANDYIDIVRALSGPALEGRALCDKLGINPTGGFSQKLKVLMESGFIARDYTYAPSGAATSLSKYRLRDNYVRFYVRYMAAKAVLINQNLYEDFDLEHLPEWQSIMGLQFENLVLNNIRSILRFLKISSETIISAAPYFQNKTQRLKACQVDLLIQTKHSLYVCEMKFRKHIDYAVVDEMQEKIKKLKIAKHYSIRPVLIYQGQLAKKIMTSDFFSHVICFEDFLL